MKDSVQTKKAKKEEKKDYYTMVMICQIIWAGLLFLIYITMISPSQKAKSELMDYIGNEMFDTSQIIASVKSYFSSDGTWQVFGNSVTLKNEKENTASQKENNSEPTTEETTKANMENTTYSQLNGTGGEDLEIYQAAENTSFARFKVTSPAVKPIENGRYTSYFGYRINPITGKFSFHTGIDIAAIEGTKIRAAYSGVVTKVSEDDRAGKYIFLSHDDGFVTFYCHCSEILAQEGAVIRQGETIAKVGTTGWSTGPHLHFEIRKNNIRYNPIYILENDS